VGGEGPGLNPAPNAPDTPAPQFKPTDFTITDDFALGDGGQKTKFRNNVAAIRLLKTLDEENRTATLQEQQVLAKYVGWGGLSQAFDDKNADWSREHAELKGLLSPEDFAAAARSTRYAHYTSREIIQDGIYAALRRFGFTGGRVLEGGVGVGNFIGLMPEDMRTAGRVTGVEREPIAVAIAKNLYPNQNIQRDDFTAFKGTDEYFDAAVGNPPFAPDSQTDTSGRKHLNGLSLHNYFFAKEVDMLREGGILAQVITNSFLDAAGDRARRYISDRTRFLGAIRLPNNAFAKNANTEVTTDLIFLQKRPESEWGGKKAREEAKAWLDVVKMTDRQGKQVNINQYFKDHPDMMLGDFGAFGTMYGPDQPALVARPGQNTLAMLREAVAKLPANVFEDRSVIGTTAANQAVVRALVNPPVAEGGYFEQDGKLMQRLPDIAGEARGTEITPDTQWTEKTKLGEPGFQRIRALAAMRVTLRELLAAELSGSNTMTELRKTLNAQYDAYVKEHARINDASTFRVFDDDPDFPLLLSLEHNYEPGIGPSAAKRLGVKPKVSTAKKAPIFERRVVESRKTVQKVETPADALAVSMAERGRLDATYIGQLLKQDPQDVLKELSSGEKPLLFMDPSSNEYVLRDAYLSGNVRQKLAQAKMAGLEGNVRALEAVQPEDVGAHQITAKVGSPWVPTSVYEDFAKELLGEGTSAVVKYVPVNGSFSVYAHAGSDLNNTNKWGIPDYPAIHLLTSLLNNRPIKVTWTDKEGTHTDIKKTEDANVKAQEIRDRFQDWLFADPDRSELLVRAYNDTNNNYVTRQYDGSWMTFPGKVPDAVIKFRRHQRNAIARIVQDRTALLDHVVGAGKTFTVVSAAMELRRTGLANKNMVAVPNHLVKQWAADFYRLYPGANILTATKKDFEKVNRRRFLAKIATGDWDAVVIAHSSFGFIRPGSEFEAAFNQKQVKLVMDTIKAVQADNGDERQKKRTVKQLEGMKERLENRIKSLRDKPMDALLDFEELGVDQLFVDEAHMFKNLMFTTKMQGVQGLGDSKGSQRAYDMYVKSQEVMEKNGRGQGLVFATGTPVSNSLAEKYHMMRYLMPRQMEELGFQSFDAWANTFASVEQVWMQKPSGDGYKASNRMSNFVNVHELLKMFDQVADTVTMDDIKKAYREENEGKEFPIPPLATGRRQPVAMQKSQAQEDYMLDIARRAKILEQRKGPPQKGEDNTLVIMGDARKAAMDIRLVDPDVTEREKGGRIDRASDEIVSRYNRFDHVKGTQVVFSDLGTPLKHAKKELAEFEALQARINAATDEVRLRASLGAEDAQAVVDDAEDAAEEMAKHGPDWLAAVKAAMRGFSVYDDLKAALVEKGIPADQIAFIHDYNTDDQKAALFRKVNAGDIRVLIGSTAKMGAGTNVQERLVAEHHLDVPWRPSDVEQREGRILRQGNVLLEQIPGFEVEILAYVTKDTLDMRMWQIQEVKLKMINQLRTRQIDREIDNAFEDMEMSAGEMQAAATGNMDLLREIQIRADIKKLEQKKRSFEAQKNDLVNRKRAVARSLEELPARIETAKEISALADQYKSELAAQAEAFRVTIDGKEYTNVREAGAYLLSKVDERIPDPDKPANEDGTPATRAAPLSVTMNGEHFTARAKLQEAFSSLRGDANQLAWRVDGKTFNRRTQAALAIQQRVADVIADEGTAAVGSIGPFKAEVDGFTTGGKKYAAMVLTHKGHKFDGQWQVGEKDTALSIAESMIDWANQRITNAGGGERWLADDLSRAKRAKEELDAAEELGDWPDQSKLEEARARHREVLARLAGNGVTQLADGSTNLRQTGSPEANETDVVFSRGRRIGGMPTTAVQSAVDEITQTWANAPEVEILASMNDAPGPVLTEWKRQNSQGAAGDIEGFHWRGKVYLVAKALGTDSDVARVLFHESLGHYGLRGVFGDALAPILNQLANARPRDIAAKAKQYGLDITKPAERRMAAEEVLAELAQTRPEIGFVQRAIAAIRTWLRENIPGLQSLALTDDEIVRNFILPARNFVERGRSEGDVAGALAFARSYQSPVWYSELSRRVEAVKMNAAPVEAWNAWLRGQEQKGVKPDEIEWSGIRDWLGMQSGKVTRDQVSEYLANNGVQVQETVLGGDGQRYPGYDADVEVLRSVGLSVETNPDDPGAVGFMDIENDSDILTADEVEAAAAEMDFPQSAVDAAHRIERNMSGRKDSTKYGTYTLPGGTNYREVLLTLPTGKRLAWVDRAGNIRQWIAIDAPWPSDEVRSAMEASGLELKAMDISEGQSVYKSSHWDQPNVLAHIRLNDRTDADGNRVLFVEEIQSDWAQAKRKGGPVDQPNRFSVRDVNGNLRGDFATADEAEAYRNNPPEHMRHLFEQRMGGEAARVVETPNTLPRVPDAPFIDKTDAWVSLALKRVIKMAVDEGYDKVAFVTGEQSAERYDLSKQISRVEYTDKGVLVATDINGREALRQQVAEDKIEDYIGKEAARKLLEAKPIRDPGRGDINAKTRRIEGDGLKVGGEGMKAFYDRIVPTVAKDVLRKLGGVALEKVEIPSKTANQVDEAGQEWPTGGDAIVLQQPGFTITDKMREQAADGVPMFSRTADPRDASTFTARARDVYADLTTTAKTFNWWNNTVGTQYQKAQQDRQFKRVFDSTQEYILDVSRLANDAADRARDLLPKLENFSDVLKDLPGIDKNRTTKADVEAIGKAIFQGTLADQREYKPAELRSVFGLTDKQVDLYRQFRAAVNKSLDDLTTTIAAKMIRNAGIPEHMFREELETGDHAALAKTVGEWVKRDPKMAGLANQVAEVSDRAKRLKAEGYAPLMRFGQYAVSIRGEAGELLEFRLFENQRLANKAAREARAAGKDAGVSVMSTQDYKLLKGINPESLELFGDLLEKAGVFDARDEVFQTYIREAIDQRSAMKRMLERHGYPGYSTDVRRVLASFLTSNARLASKNLHFTDMLEAVENIPKSRGDVRDDATNLVKYVQEPTEEAPKLRALLFAQYIGGNVASAMVNMTQSLTMTLPYLSQFGTPASAAKTLASAMRQAAGGKVEGELGEALARAEQAGVVSPQEIHHLNAEAMGTFGSNPVVQKAMFLWGSLFSLAEQFNRRAAFIAAYNMAPAGKSAYDFAVKAVEETQGIYNRGNRPNWARGAVGATLFTFKQFSVSYLEFLSRLPKREKVLALAILMLAAGAEGLPFADDLDDVIDTIAQRLGYSFNSKEQKRRFIGAVLGQGGAEFVLRGASAVPGMPIDISQRMGMANLLPGTGIFRKDVKDHMRDVVEFFGPVGGLAQNAARGELRPTAIANLGKAIDMFQTGMYRDDKGRRVVDVDAVDAAWKAIGFQPAVVAQTQMKTRMVQQDINLAKTVEAEIADSMAEARFEHDPAKLQDARDRLKDWNEKNPTDRIRIDGAQIVRRLREMRKTREQRIIKSAPRELRAEVRSALQ